jgi:hypothetical protein
MIDLAISIDTDAAGTTIVETNNGSNLRAPTWPQDCDFQLVAFNPSSKRCEVVWAEELANDICTALVTLDRMAALRGPRPDWYRRLKLYARGASAREDKPV